MDLAIFDLDNTLLDGDSDYLWAKFLINHGILNGQEYEQRNQYFYQEYKNGTLDIHQFLDFQLQPLAQYSMQQLNSWHSEFMQEYILPIVLPAAKKLVLRHKNKNHVLIIITATNKFVTAPIARLFGIDYLLATEPEIIDDRYTGKVTGVPCFQEGKVERLESWLAQHNANLDHSWFYSDSHNDIPLLDKVATPVVVDGDEKLIGYAKTKNWQQISLRGD